MNHAGENYRLSARDRRAYFSGEWLGQPVTTGRIMKRRRKRWTDENAAAELAARVRLMLQEGA